MAARNKLEEVKREIEMFFVEKEIDQWQRSSEVVSILILGQTGTGKSTLVNSLLGQCVADEGDDLDPQTNRVTLHSTNYNGVIVHVWDSPGLEDGSENDYLEEIKFNCKNSTDLFICCLRMDDKLIQGNSDIKSMRQITAALGQDEVWKHAIVVLTFANEAIDDEKMRIGDSKTKELQAFYVRKMEYWRKRLHVAFQEEIGLPEELAQSIEIIPAGYHQIPQIEGDPEGRCWLSRVWLHALLATKPRAQPALIKLNAHRLMQLPVEGVSEKDIMELVQKQQLIFHHKGLEIGNRLGAAEAGQIIGSKIGSRNNFSLILILLVAYFNNMITIDEFRENIAHT